MPWPEIVLPRGEARKSIMSASSWAVTISGIEACDMIWSRVVSKLWLSERALAAMTRS